MRRASLTWSFRTRLTAAILLVLAALTAFAYIEHENRQSIIRLSATNIQASAGRLAERYPIPVSQCRINEPLDDFNLLAGAVASVEQIATSSLERLFEYGIVHLAALTGLATPDFSLGAGQVRPTTAIAALEYEAHAGGNSQRKKISQDDIALDLLSRCRNHELTVLVLHKIADGLIEAEKVGKARSGAQLLRKFNRQFVMQIAAEYNAQVASLSPEAAIANYIYRELVYQVFQEFRFRFDRAPASEPGHSPTD